MRGSQVRGLKTFATLRNDAVKSKFLPHWMKHHLFGGDRGLTNGEQGTITAPSGETRDVSCLENISLPNLHGKSIQSHIQEVSERHVGVYRNLLKKLAHGNCPPIPVTWTFKSGWTCYREGCEPQQVDFPDEDAIIFDTEVCVKESFAPVLATAVSPSAWYSWVSPVLTNIPDQKKSHVHLSDLVPMGDQGQRPRILIGHFVCFDSARIQECYALPKSGLKFFDTMAAHISVSGISDLQRYFLLGSSKKPEWAELACSNSLSQLHRLYCGKDLDKTERDIFVKGSLSEIAERFQELCLYCALDVKATHSVYCEVLPLFLDRCPHGATLAAMLEMSSMFVPVGEEYERILENVRETSTAEDKEVKLLLQDLARDALNLMDGEKYKNDPWMWDQDWSTRSRKKTQNIDRPEWYRKLIAQVDIQSSDDLDIHINFRRNISAKLMQLCWGSYPLHFELKQGWGLLMPALKATDVTDRNIPVASVRKVCKSIFPPPRVSLVPSLKDFVSLQSGITAANSGVSSGAYGYKAEKTDNYTQFFIQNGVLFKKLPHHMSMEKNVGGALSVHLLTNQCLRSGNEKGQRILNILRKNVYWKRNGKSFVTLPVVWFDEQHSRGAVVPSASAFGDFTRLPKEMFFSSLCNEVSESTGTEMSMALKAPPGWCFLSANMHQADLKMISLLSDSQRGEYCRSSLGQMFVEGQLYGSIAERMKLSPHQSELVFHAVMWGANKRYLAKVLREINPLLSDVTVYERAEVLLEYFSGNVLGLRANMDSKPGGILSEFQVTLKEVLERKNIATPILQSRLSRVLENDPHKFFSLIQNWLIKSSVADFLHILMLCFHDILPSARLCTISSHDLLIKYLVPENEKFRAAKSLHIAHLYAAAYCAAQVGLSDIPEVAAKLPFVTLSPTIREDASHCSQRLTFQEALENSESECPTEN